MTEPTSTSDPTTAILVAVTKMDGKLDTALAVQALHSDEITVHRAKIDDHGNRLVALETQRVSDGDHEQRNVSNRAVFWTAAAGLTAIVGLIITLFIATHGG